MTVENEERLRMVAPSWVDFEHARHEFDSLQSPAKKLKLLPRMIECLETTLKVMPNNEDIKFLLVQCRDAERTLVRAALKERARQAEAASGKVTTVWQEEKGKGRA